MAAFWAAAPEGVKWSPDGTKVSYVQRDDSGERGALYYIDLATGKPAVLVSSEKLSSLAPSAKLGEGRAAEGEHASAIRWRRTTGLRTRSTCCSTRWASSGFTAWTLEPRCR